MLEGRRRGPLHRVGHRAVLAARRAATRRTGGSGGSARPAARPRGAGVTVRRRRGAHLRRRRRRRAVVRVPDRRPLRRTPGYPIGARSLRMLASRGTRAGRAVDRTHPPGVRQPARRRPGAGARGRGAGALRPVQPLPARVARRAQPAAAQRVPHLHRRPPPAADRGQRERATCATCRAPTCCWSARCCTTSARAIPATTPRSGMELVDDIARADGVHRPRTSRSSARWSSTTCCWPETATRRDLSRSAHRGQRGRGASATRVTLELLDALTEADSRATGPSAWSSWKASLIDELVRPPATAAARRAAVAVEPHRSTADASRRLVAAGDGRRWHARRARRRTATSTCCASPAPTVAACSR